MEIEVYEDGKRKWSSTGVRVYLDQWKDGMVVNHIDAAEMNMRLHRLYEEAVRNSGDIGLMAVSEIQMGKRDVCDWMEDQIAERTDIAEITRSAHFRTVEYLRQSGLFHRFSDLTERNVTLWDQDLKKCPGRIDLHIEKNNSRATVTSGWEQSPSISCRSRVFRG